jgi:hypothetical protein
LLGRRQEAGITILAGEAIAVIVAKAIDVVVVLVVGE